ncbi:MAG: cell division protein FtsW [Planctomycetes bacterium]|nr:cell division protein FtsW [Planctomycetota bacterium]NOG53294.1 cell division protein FtsW [Planctomycetota bacterium]
MPAIRPGQVVALCVVALLTLGIVMVTSAGLSVDPAARQPLLSVLTGRTTIYAALAILMLVAGSRVNLHRLDPACSSRRWWLQIPPWLFVASVILLGLVYVPGIGRMVNNSHRWISLGVGAFSISFQPSEFAKWTLIIVIAWYLCLAGPARVWKFCTGLVPALLLICIVCGTIVLEDLGTAVLIGLVAVSLLYLGGARVAYLVYLSPAALACLYWMIASSEYRRARIEAFLHPFDDPEGVGYHIIQSMAAIMDGRITGRGLGHGVHKYGYLPEDTTDFLFAIICEELGLLGAALIATIFLTLILAGIRIAQKQQTSFTRLIAIGIVMTVALQTAMNLMVVTCLAPTKGIALPLVSAGGSGWLLTAFSLGLLISLERKPAEQNVDVSCACEPSVNEIAAAGSLSV